MCLHRVFEKAASHVAEGSTQRYSGIQKMEMYTQLQGMLKSGNNLAVLFSLGGEVSDRGKGGGKKEKEG